MQRTGWMLSLGAFALMPAFASTTLRDAPGRVLVVGAVVFGVSCIGLMALPNGALEQGESRLGWYAYAGSGPSLAWAGDTVSISRGRLWSASTAVSVVTTIAVFLADGG